MSNGENGFISLEELLYIKDLKKFIKENNFKESNYTKDLEKVLARYGIDIKLLADEDESLKNKRKTYKIPNICEEILVAMKKMYDEKQSIYTKDIKNVTADDLKKHNKLIYEEIENFPDVVKNSIKDSDTYKFNKKLDEYLDILMNKMQVLFTMVFSESNLDLGNQMEIVINLFDQLILSYAKSLSDKEKITKAMEEIGQEEIISINKNSVANINKNYLNKKTGYLLDNEIKRVFVENIQINNEIEKMLKEKDQVFRRNFKQNMTDSNDILEWYGKELKKDIRANIAQEYSIEKNIDSYLSFPYNIADILIKEFNLQINKIANLCIDVYYEIGDYIIVNEFENPVWIQCCLDDYNIYITRFEINYKEKYKEFVSETYKKMYYMLFSKYGFICNDIEIDLFRFYEYILENVIRDSAIEYFEEIFAPYKEQIIDAIKKENFTIFTQIINKNICKEIEKLIISIKKSIEEYLYEGREKREIEKSNKKLEDVYNKIISMYDSMEKENKKLQDLINEKEELENKLGKLDKKTKEYKNLKSEIEKKDNIIRKTRDMRTSISNMIGQSLVNAIQKDKEFISSQVISKEDLNKN